MSEIKDDCQLESNILNISDTSIVLGKWGNKIPISNTENKPIQLHNPPNILSKNCEWYSNWKDLNIHIKYKDITILEKELGLKNIKPDKLIIWKNWGIHTGENPSFKWTYKIKKLIAKRQKLKNSLDINMYQAIVPLPQEVYTLCEKRKNRSILVFDIKSAYPSTIVNLKFPDPATLKYIDHKNIQSYWKNDQYPGIYRVSVTLKENAPAWFTEWHPFVLMHNMQGYKFKYPTNKPLITWLHTNEICSWETFLNIKPIDGIVGNIHKHPLANVTANLLSLKQNNTNPLDQAQIKWLLSRIHSASTMKRLKFVNNQTAMKWFKYIGSKPTYKHNHIQTPSGYWQIPNITNSENVYAWNAHITGYLRGYWLRFLTAIIQKEPTALLCYANTDSMHISIKTEKVEDLTKHLTELGLLGNTPGLWSLTHQAEQGLWLATNKYWLLKNGKIIKSTVDGESWRLKDKRDMLYKGQRKIWYKSLWHSLSSMKNTIIINKDLIIQKRRNIDIILNDENFRREWNKETLYSRNLKKKLWYTFRKLTNEEKNIK